MPIRQMTSLQITRTSAVAMSMNMDMLNFSLRLAVGQKVIISKVQMDRPLTSHMPSAMAMCCTTPVCRPYAIAQTVATQMNLYAPIAAISPLIIRILSMLYHRLYWMLESSAGCFNRRLVVNEERLNHM